MRYDDDDDDTAHLDDNLLLFVPPRSSLFLEGGIYRVHIIIHQLLLSRTSDPTSSTAHLGTPYEPCCRCDTLMS